MKLFNFIKKRNEAETTPIINEEIINPTEIELSIENELSKTILRSLSLDDIIYAEEIRKKDDVEEIVSQIAIYIIQNEELICYKTNLFKDTYIWQIQSLFHCLCNKFSFNEFYESVSRCNGFVNKKNHLKVTEEYFVYKKNNKEYRIYSSVPRVLLARGIKFEWFEKKFLNKKKQNPCSNWAF